MGARHTLRSPVWPGWIDVQRFRVPPPRPAALLEYAHLLAQRHEIEGNTSVVHQGVTRLGGQEVAVEEATITRSAGSYRRRTFLRPIDDEVIAVDMTAQAALAQLRLETWELPTP